MPPFLGLALAGLALAAPPAFGAEPAVTATTDKRLVELRLESGGIAGGLSYTVLLPEAHGTPGRRFPVAFFLHGFGADRAQWLADGALAARIDALVAAGRLRPLIAVMPDGGNSWYLDSARFGGHGDVETAIARDLVAEIDRRFMTEPARASRAVVGLSMGGFGALRLAFRHPETFGTVAAMSPAIWKPGALSWSHGPAALPPGDAAAKFFRTTGTEGFDADAFARLVPFAYVGAVAALAEPPRIMLTVGDDDYFEHYDGTAEMFLELRAAGLKPALRVADGGHSWDHWGPMADEVLRFLGEGWRPES